MVALQNSGGSAAPGDRRETAWLAGANGSGHELIDTGSWSWRRQREGLWARSSTHEPGGPVALEAQREASVPQRQPRASMRLTSKQGNRLRLCSGAPSPASHVLASFTPPRNPMGSAEPRPTLLQTIPTTTSSIFGHLAIVA
jgi:hypothetical protein